MDVRPTLATLLSTLQQLGTTATLQLTVPSVTIASVCVQPSDAGTSTPRTTTHDDNDLLTVLSNLTEVISIEVVDEFCTINDTQKGRKLTGPMNYKLKSMDKMSLKYVLIDESKITDAGGLKEALLKTLMAKQTN